MQRDQNQAKFNRGADARSDDVVLICLSLPIIAVAGLVLIGIVSQQVALWLAADQKVGVSELHRRQLLLRAGNLDNPEPTLLSALVVHGLHDSPKAMTDLAEVVANHSVNTLVSRMRGHFETDRSVLKRTVRWEQWLADAEADLALAQRLGGKVVLMGHSTGALLLTWLAIRTPVKVAGLILFSPAFGVHSFAQAGAPASYSTRIDLVTADGKVSTGHSGLEVGRAARAFRAWLKANSGDGGLYTYASERLKDVPVWMANTAADIVIQKQGARAFMGALKGKSSSAVCEKNYGCPIPELCATMRSLRRPTPTCRLSIILCANF
jgi:pimeloyl-ACP methyl ester carboxylesterase